MPQRSSRIQKLPQESPTTSCWRPQLTVVAGGLCALALLVVLAGCSRPEPKHQTIIPHLEGKSPVATKPEPAESSSLTDEDETEAETVVRINTEKGDIIAKLYDEKAPITAGNFLLLVKSGFYDGLIFHRVVPDFVIQGGDPAGDGSGGPGFTIPDEFDAELSHDRGILSMANAGSNTGGSQFFVCLEGKGFTDGLDYRHSVFGEVIEGMDVADSIRPGDKIVEITVESESPNASAAQAAAEAARVPE